MKPTTDADSILKCIDRWDRNLFAVHDVERRIMEYANGGLPPSDNCDDDVVPLGFASSRLKREMEPLLDPLMLDPGFVHMRCVVPAINDAQRTSQIEMQVNAEVNAIVRTRMQVPLTQAAGRATVTGRAFLYRTSPNDWVLKNGRMLYPEDAGVDIQDSTWREWSFPGRISLRDIEERIKGSSEGKPGWNKIGLENLKKWILAGEADKYRNSANTAGWMKRYDRDVWATLDLTGTAFSEPVDVYWYFRKNGKITSNSPLYGGHEGVDLYCISRFGSQRQVAEEVRDQVIHKKLTVAYPNGGKEAFTKLEKETDRYIESEMEKEEYDEPNERLLFYMPNIFASIESCLVFHNDDASVAGDQLMSEVRGGGKTMMPKLAVMENLLTSLVQGVSFAAQVTWSVQPGVGEEYLQQLQRGGIRPGQAFPSEVQLMSKQNSMTGFGPAVQAINLIDQGISADSGAAQTGAFGGNKAEFASQALADQNLRQSSMGRRMSNWLMTLSKVATIVTSTLCRHWPEQRSQFPCFPDASRLKVNLSTKFKIHPDEWDAERWEVSARRLAGDMTRDQSVMVNTQLIEIIGPIMPSILPFLAKEILRARLGDTIAYQLTSEDPKKNESQEMEARENCAIALTTAFPPPVTPMSDPMVNSAIASQLAEARIKSAGAAGSITGAEQAGVLAIIQYAASHVARVPEQLAKPAMDRLAQLAKVVNSIPLTQPPAPDAMTQNELVQAQLKAQNNVRLEKEGAEKLQLKSNEQLMKMRQLGNAEMSQEEQKKNLATQRASEYQKMAISLAEANKPDGEV